MNAEENDLLKKALLKIELQKNKIDSLQNKLCEPIAIIGQSCRFPAGANSPEEFWELLTQGFNAVTEIPTARWNVEDYYSENEDEPGKSYARHGAFITQPVDEFDPMFFNITPKEAEMIDPRQRLLLEVVWQAFEDAMIPEQEFRNTKTGVFIGMMNNDFSDLLQNVAEINAHAGSGLGASLLAGRLSYALGLQGPSIAIDTSCSSSLVAIHLACQSLRLGESKLALAGGVNLMLSPRLHIACGKGKMLSKDGACKTFDEQADGYVRGEGCGIIVLKRLNDAINDKDRILAVIKGSAVNQDGTSSGLTVPNGVAQESVIREALQHAQLSPDAIDYIEAHGTGTRVGDPIEMNALSNIFSGDTERSRALLIGAVKTNIGHLEPAAGIAAVIKTILALNHEIIPQNLHFNKLNPMIDLQKIPAELPVEQQAWKKTTGKKRIAGVSSFGICGTNAHLILEETPLESQGATQEIDNADRQQVLFISAKTQDALERLITSYIRFLKNTKQSLEAICYNSQHTITRFPVQIAIQGRSIDELIECLETKQWKPVSEVENLLLQKSSLIPKIKLPGYPFIRQRCWPENLVSSVNIATTEAKIPEESVISLEELTSLDAKERGEAILSCIREIVLKVIGIEQTTTHDSTDFLALGIDSLMVAEINKVLKTRFPFLQTNNTAIFDYPSIKSLAEYISNQAVKEDDAIVNDSLSTQELMSEIEHISFDTSTWPKEHKKTNVCLITGATGFLGAHLLHDVLCKTQNKVYCLLRSEVDKSAEDRLMSILKNYQLVEGINFDRLQILNGDFTQPQLGLENDVYIKLAKELDTIYHVGADVNFIKPLNSLKSANVDSCLHILNLAQKENLKQIHYVSTLAAIPRGGDYVNGDLSENTPLDLSGVLVGGYEQSKWLGEMLMHKAQKLNFPITIYRPSIIGGSLQSGILNNKDIFCRSLKTFIETKSVPDNMTFNFNVVPVDYITESIVFLAQQETRLPIYHFFHSEPLTTQDIYMTLVDLGFDIKMEDYPAWMEHLQEWGETHDYPLKPLLSFLARNEMHNNEQLKEQAIAADQGNIHAELTKNAIPEDISNKLLKTDKLLNLYIKKLI